MARKARAEVEGGLYHIIFRGNNRRRIFDSAADYEKLLSLLAVQKIKVPFFLYAYCLMTNHVHLLIERQKDSVGRIMHRVLTGYSQYYNRRHQRIGHLLQGRHKAILCQSDRYLAELVRYIHLNPVRAKMVSQPEQYQYSSHRAYSGLESAGIVDVEPVLRHFGAQKQFARESYRQFVAAGMMSGHQEQFYLAEEGRILGTEEFIDATIHRLGESVRSDPHKNRRRNQELNLSALIESVEVVCDVPRELFCGSGKRACAVRAKELFLVTGTEMGISLKTLAGIIGLHSSTTSRRHDSARLKMIDDEDMSKLAAEIMQRFNGDR